MGHAAVSSVSCHQRHRTLFPDLKHHPHLQFLDSGLLNHVLRTTGLYFKDEDLSAVFQGCLAEQVVGQELLVLGWWVAIVH